MISMRGGFLCVWTGKLHGFVPWILVKNCYRQTTIQLNEFPNKKTSMACGIAVCLPEGTQVMAVRVQQKIVTPES
jgi:hypothetical protein